MIRPINMPTKKPSVKNKLERPFDDEATTKRQEGEIFKSFLDQNTISRQVSMFKSQFMTDECFASNNFHSEMFRDEVARRLVGELSLKVASKKMDSRTVIYPSNWWESFKKRWAPPWFLKRYPVRHEQVTFEATAYYPDIQIPDHAAYVDIITRVKNRMYS